MTIPFVTTYQEGRPQNEETLRTWQVLRAAELISLGVPFADAFREHIDELL